MTGQKINEQKHFDPSLPVGLVHEEDLGKRQRPLDEPHAEGVFPTKTGLRSIHKLESMPPAYLIRFVGITLYGQRWENPLAYLIGMRKVYMWRQGEMALIGEEHAMWNGQKRWTPKIIEALVKTLRPLVDELELRLALFNETGRIEDAGRDGTRIFDNKRIGEKDAQ